MQLPDGASRSIEGKRMMADTTTIGSGSPEAGKSAAPSTAVVEQTSATDTQTAGKPTKKKARVQLPLEDEFAILLSQVSSCREAGLKARWVQLCPEHVVALVLPDVKFCENKHLYIGEECNYCKP
jgi:hypothetical protein